MRTVGFVIARKDDTAEVVLGPHGECRKCGACLSALDDKMRSAEAINSVQAQVGQTVEVEIPPARAVASAFLIFVFPLIVAVAAGFLGVKFAKVLGIKPDYFALLLGVGGFAGSLTLLRRIDRRYARRNLPIIVSIIEKT